MESLQMQLSTLIADLDRLTTRVEQLELGPIAPSRWCWRDSTPDAAERLWAELNDWVEAWLLPRYELAEQIPPCWAKHGPMVEELSALYAGWYTAYLDPNSRGGDPLAWHEALARVLARLREWNAMGCGVGVPHRPTSGIDEEEGRTR